MQVPLSLLSWRWLPLLPALCCLSCSGGGSLHPVQGKVLYKNEPIKGAVVFFHPNFEVDEITFVRPTGVTNEEGVFTLTTGKDEGAPAGQYLVTVTWPEEVKRKGMSMEPPDSRDRLQGAYADRSKFKHKVEIKKGPNQLEPIQLK